MVLNENNGQENRLARVSGNQQNGSRSFFSQKTFIEFDQKKPKNPLISYTYTRNIDKLCYF